MTANLSKFICKSNINRTECVLYNLCHLSCTDARNNNLALTEGSIDFLNLLANFSIISTDGSVVVKKFINHISRNNSLRSMNEVNILANLKSRLFHYRTNKLVDCSRRNSRFNDNSRSLRADAKNLLYCCNNVLCINLLRELIIRCRHRNNICICYLIFRRKLNACFKSISKKLIQTNFFKGCLCSIQSSY